MLKTMKNGPCKDCSKRTATCKFDGTCSKYADWKAEHEADIQHYRNTFRGSRLYNENRRDRIAEYNRRKRKK